MNYNKSISHVFYHCNIGILFALAVVSVFPPIRSIAFLNQLWAVLLLGWFATITMAYPKFWFNSTFHRLIIYAYIVYVLIVANFSGNGVMGNRYFELFQIPLFFIAYYTYTQMGRIQACRRVVLGLIPFLIFTCISTIRACISNPFAARYTKGSLEALANMRVGIGGYELIYFLVVAFAICLHLYFSIFSFKYKIGLGVLMVLFFTTILVSNFMTALLLTIVSVAVKMLFSKITISRILFITLTILFLSVYSNIILVAILDMVIGVMGESMNAARLLELKILLLENEQGVSMQARSNAYSESFELIIKHPFFGILTKPLIRVGDGVLGFGQHSQILDTFALFGIPLGLVQVYIYFKPLISRIKQHGQRISSFAFLITLLSGVIFTMNVATPSIGFAVFFIFPVVYDYLNQEYLTQEK